MPTHVMPTPWTSLENPNTGKYMGCASLRREGLKCGADRSMLIYLVRARANRLTRSAHATERSTVKLSVA